MKVAFSSLDQAEQSSQIGGAIVAAQAMFVVQTMLDRCGRIAEQTGQSPHRADLKLLPLSGFGPSTFDSCRSEKPRLGRGECFRF